VLILTSYWIVEGAMIHTNLWNSSPHMDNGFRVMILMSWILEFQIQELPGYYSPTVADDEDAKLMHNAPANSLAQYFSNRFAIVGSCIVPLPWSRGLTLASAHELAIASRIRLGVVTSSSANVLGAAYAAQVTQR